MKNEITIDMFDLKGTIKGLKSFCDNLDKEMDELIKDVVENGETYLKALYSSKEEDPNIGEISTDYKKINDGYELIAKGKDIVYEEFGTGDKGLKHPHPVKSDYNLNDYNSGSFIMDVEDVKNDDMLNLLAQNNITSGKFWRYRKNGELHLTQGVPSGQEMWKTRNNLIKTIPEIVEKRRKIINDNIIRSIAR